MANFGVMSDNMVTNVIIADSKEIAEKVTSLTCIEYTEENPAVIGGDYIDGYFYSLKPFPSWNRNGSGSWIAPVEKPEFDEANPIFYAWNEETLSWDAQV